MIVYDKIKDDKVVAFPNLKPTELIYDGSVGLDILLTKEKLLDWCERGFFDSTEDFEHLLVCSYDKYCDWGSYVTDRKLGKALYARALVNLSRYFKKLDKGEYVCIENKFYNGDVHVPSYIDEEYLYVFRSTFFTKFAFKRIVDDTYGDVHKSLLLKPYVPLLDEFDNKNELKINRMFKDDTKFKDLIEFYEEGIFLPLLSINVQLKLKDSYVYITRGKTLYGAGKKSITVTGILETTDIEKMINIELKEELGISNISKTLRPLGLALFDKNFRGNRSLETGLVYELELDISQEELLKSYAGAEDNYEVENIFFIEGDLSDYINHLDNLISNPSEDISGNLLGVLHLLKLNQKTMKK